MLIKVEHLLLKKDNSERRCFFIACLLIFFSVIESFACVMVPSVWKTIDSSTENLQSPTVYAVTEAFMQFKKKFAKEMKVCGIPVKPFCVRSLFSGKESEVINKETYTTIKDALAMVFIDAIISDYDNLPKAEDISSQETTIYDERYFLDLYVSDSKRTSIHMIDLNMQVWALLRFIVRDETSVYVRVSDSSDNIIFLDEFNVSPTIAVEPIISPIGGYFETVEKNNSMPIHIDWGSIGDSKEHVLRVNTNFYAPSDIPPLDVFKSDLVKSLEKEEINQNACSQLIYAIKAGDVSLAEVILDTYQDSCFDIADNEGKTPIQYAESAGFKEIVKKLSERKTNH